MVFEGLDNDLDGRRKVGSASPVGEKVDVAAAPVAHPVRPYRVPAGQRQAVFASGCQGDLGDPAVLGLHNGSLGDLRGPTEVGQLRKLLLPRGAYRRSEP